MANHPECPLCSKRFTQHAPTLYCSTCKFDVHISCLPFYSALDIVTINEGVNNWSCTQCLSTLFPFYDIEENHELIHFLYSNKQPSLINLENMLYDPFDTNQDGGALEDVDPDDGYYNLQNILTTTPANTITQISYQIY
jgi:hypothetical protein